MREIKLDSMDAHGGSGISHELALTMTSILPKGDESRDPQVRVKTLIPDGTQAPLQFTDIVNGLSSVDLRQNEINRLLASLNRATDVLLVAESKGLTKGVLAMRHVNNLTAEIRSDYLFVDLENAPLIYLLIESAMKYCREHGLLKVILGPEVIRTREALEKFDGKGWRYSRRWSPRGTEFYLDLYYRDDEPYHVTPETDATDKPVS